MKEKKKQTLNGLSGYAVGLEDLAGAIAYRGPSHMPLAAKEPSRPKGAIVS